MSCPHCDQAAAFHDDRDRTVTTLCGPVTYTRAYYYCRRCGQGYCPSDDRMGMTDRYLSPAAGRLATLAGAVTDSYEKAAELVREMAALTLSESTVARVTEDTGDRIAAYLAAVTFGPDRDWTWRTDARGRTVAYISLDATGTRQQGPGGTRAEGRMAYVGAVYNPPAVDWLQPPGPAPPVQARYVSGLYPLAQLGPLMRRQGAAVGMERAKVWVALSDGANGYEDFWWCNFGRAELVVILDFYHPATYLEALAKAACPHDAAAAVALAGTWCGLLKTEGGATTLAVLRAWDFGPRRSKGLREQLAKVEEYFGNNLHRMEYPEYLAEGWHIGSGVIESACKTVVGQRLKGAGKRWSEHGAHAMCHVRALYRSERGQWEAFWKRQFTTRANVQQQS